MKIPKREFTVLVSHAEKTVMARTFGAAVHKVARATKQRLIAATEEGGWMNAWQIVPDVIVHCACEKKAA